MYSVLIVDDEEFIREGIARVIRTQCPQFNRVYEAHNGEQALSMTLEYAPDLIITDIQMPIQNGLEFIEQVKAENVDAAIVIISGYDDFEYAQQGLRLAVNDYLLKPVESDHLAARLQQIADELDQKHLFHKNQSEIQRIVEESLPLYRERLYRNLIEGRKDGSEYIERAHQLGISFDRSYYAAALIRYHISEEHAAGAFLADAMMTDIVAGAASRFIQDLDVHSFFVRDRELVLLIGSSESTKELSFAVINQYLLRLEKALHNNLQLEHLNIALGSISQSIADLALSYKQAQEAMLYRLSVKNQVILNFEELASLSVPETQERSRAEELILQVKLLNKARAMQCIHNYIEDITSIQGAHPHWVKLSILELAMSLLRIMQDAKLDLSPLLQQPDIDPYVNVYRLDLVSELQRWLEHFVGRCIAEMEKSALHKGVSHVEKVKQYIEAHFSDSSLSISAVASRLFLSPNYLRQLFRQETGESFVEQLTRIRMEHAVVYLKDPLLKIQDVAEKVGFEEQRYFSSCFKKYYAMTPSEYREAMQSGLL